MKDCSLFLSFESCFSIALLKSLSSATVHNDCRCCASFRSGLGCCDCVSLCLVDVLRFGRKTATERGVKQHPVVIFVLLIGMSYNPSFGLRSPFNMTLLFL